MRRMTLYTSRLRSHTTMRGQEPGGGSRRQEVCYWRAVQRLRSGQCCGRESRSGYESERQELICLKLSLWTRGALQAILRRGEQAVVLLNRRGYSSFLQCTECGGVPACDHCEIALTYHRSAGVLRCHHCGYQNRAPGICPTCGSGSLSRGAPGTQRVE